MLLTTLVPFLLAAVPSLAQDIVYDSIHNATAITGTWSTGSKAVSTGAGFANPRNQTFIYPTNTGESYSFTDDGHYEVARYRFNSNGSEPNCITGVMVWHHGTYDLLGNGSIVLNPLPDGYQQIQSPCAAVSNFIEQYNMTELMTQWRIFLDPIDGPKLHLWRFDGSPVAPQFQLSATPNMLPTQLLRNVTGFEASITAQQRRALLKRNAGERAWTPNGIGALLISTVIVGAASLFF